MTHLFLGGADCEYLWSKSRPKDLLQPIVDTFGREVPLEILYYK